MVIGGLWNDETVRLSIEVDNFDVDMPVVAKILLESGGRYADFQVDSLE